MQKPQLIPKAWGAEHIWASNELYAGKILEFDGEGALMSMHFHLEKHETWYCLSGRFLLYWIDPTTADRHQETFGPGDVWTNAPGEPHQLKCLEPGQILEVSTRDNAKDNYRVEKGDSQKQAPQADIPTADCPACTPPPRMPNLQKYSLECCNCGHRWHAKQPMGGYACLRCPHCGTPVDEPTWDAKRAVTG